MPASVAVPKSTTRHRTRRSLGLCVICPAPAIGVYCEVHRRARNTYQRERRRAQRGYKRRYLNAESYQFEGVAK